ncbi:unnamed protein product [Rangifer tarandus platyrhynchus]|uniref:Uncharacterized protein n=1 Tax=Rangifer tarandus platyrhynchus TaxID=3082113 RepID=A0AC59ZH88_RANTA
MQAAECGVELGERRPGSQTLGRAAVHSCYRPAPFPAFRLSPSPSHTYHHPQANSTTIPPSPQKTPDDSELVSSVSGGWNCSFCPRDRHPYFMTGRAHPSLPYFCKAAFLSHTDKPPSSVSQLPVHVGGGWVCFFFSDFLSH